MENQIVNKNFMFHEQKLNVLGTIDKPYFFASQIAKMMGYVDTRSAINDHVSADFKKLVKELKTDIGESPLLQSLHPKTILISEPGLYELILSSKLERAKEFRNWVLSDVLPTIRKTGSYNSNLTINQQAEPIRKQLTHNQFLMVSENDLQKKIVDYIRNYHKDIQLSVGLVGTLTKEQIKHIIELGYDVGSPDLTINVTNKHFNRLCFEFKTPEGTGKLNVNQIAYQKKLDDDVKYIVCSNYDEAIRELEKYLSERIFKCKYCEKRFVHRNYHSIESLNNHFIHIHRM